MIATFHPRQPGMGGWARPRPAAAAAVAQPSPPPHPRRHGAEIAWRPWPPGGQPQAGVGGQLRPLAVWRLRLNVRDGCRPCDAVCHPGALGTRCQRATRDTASSQNRFSSPPRDSAAPAWSTALLPHRRPTWQLAAINWWQLVRGAAGARVRAGAQTQGWARKRGARAVPVVKMTRHRHRLCRRQWRRRCRRQLPRR